MHIWGQHLHFTYLLLFVHIFSQVDLHIKIAKLLFQLEGEGEGRGSDPLDDIFLIVFQKQREVHQDP